MGSPAAPPAPPAADGKPDAADPSPPAASTPPLFERVGGMKALVNAVDIFYARVGADPELAPFFVGIDMRGQRIKQVQFLCYAFGGPDQYLGRSVADAHARIITEMGAHRGHFWRVADHLRAALEQLAVPAPLIEECLANIAPAASVFPEPGAPAVVGPEPVPAAGTPAAAARERE